MRGGDPLLVEGQGNVALRGVHEYRQQHVAAVRRGVNPHVADAIAGGEYQLHAAMQAGERKEVE